MARHGDDTPVLDVTNICAWEDRLDTLTYHEILNVSDSADGLECERAYHHFALQFHPDCYPELPVEIRHAITRIFQRGVEARRVLCDPELRRRYAQQVLLGETRLIDDKPAVRIDLGTALVTLHESCRSAGAKLQAMAAARAHQRGDMAQVRRLLLQALAFDGDANASIRECVDALGFEETQ